MTREQLVKLVKDLLSTGYQENLNDDLIVRGLNEGAKKLQKQAKFPSLRSWASWSLVQYEQNYALPSDYVDDIGVTFDWERPPLLNVEQFEIVHRLGDSPAASATKPQWYMVHSIGSTRYIRVWKRPDTAADSTTLDSSLSDSETDTMSVADSAGFTTSGRVLINSEVIGYNNVDSDNNNLEGLTRGMEGTTAASHSSSDTVTQRDLQLLYFKEPAELTADGDAWVFDSDYHDIPAWYALHLYEMRNRNGEQAAFWLAQFNREIERAKRETHMDRVDRVTQVKNWIDYANVTV